MDRKALRRVVSRFSSHHEWEFHKTPLVQPSAEWISCSSMLASRGIWWELMGHGRWCRLMVAKYSARKESLKPHQKSLIFEFYDILPDMAIKWSCLWNCLRKFSNQHDSGPFNLCCFNHTAVDQLTRFAFDRKTSKNAKLMKSEIIEGIGERGPRKSVKEMTLGGSMKFHNFEARATEKKLRKIKIYSSMIKEIYELS